MATTSKATQSVSGGNKETETKKTPECQNQIPASEAVRNESQSSRDSPLQQSHKQTSRQIHTDADEEDGRTFSSPVCYYGDFAMEDFNPSSKTSKDRGTGS